MGLLKWILGKPNAIASPVERKAALIKAMSVEVDDDYFPSIDDFRGRLAATGLFHGAAIDWLAESLHKSALSQQGYEKATSLIVSSGSLLNAEQKKAMGLPSRAPIGSDFIAAINGDWQEARRAIFITMQYVVSQAKLKYDIKRMKAAGVLRVQFRSCQDERDCSAARQAEGKSFAIESAKLPLANCDAEYCRCTFAAIVEFD